MYASNLFRVFSFCNRNLTFTRQILCSQLNLNSDSFVNNLYRYKSSSKNKILTNVLFSTTSSPDDNHNVSKGKVPNKRRRIISSSSSDDNEPSSPSKTAENAK